MSRPPRTPRLDAQLIIESVNLRTWSESACERAADKTTATESCSKRSHVSNLSPGSAGRLVPTSSGGRSGVRSMGACKPTKRNGSPFLELY